MNRRVFYTATFVLLLAFAVFSTIKLSNVTANNDGIEPKHKSYISYEIQPEDTLISIAKEYTQNFNISVDEYVEEVRKNNNLSGDKITTGKHLIIAKYEY